MFCFTVLPIKLNIQRVVLIAKKSLFFKTLEQFKCVNVILHLHLLFMCKLFLARKGFLKAISKM